MSLQKIVEKATSELRDKALDPFARYFLESFGPITGIVLADVIGVPVALTAADLLGKALVRLWSPKRQGVKRFLEHFPFYLASVRSVYAVANNIAVYYLGPV